MLHELAGLCSRLCLIYIFSWFYKYCRQMVSFPISCNVIHLGIYYIFPDIHAYCTMNITGRNILHRIDFFSCMFLPGCSFFLWGVHLLTVSCFFVSLLKLYRDAFLSFRISYVSFLQGLSIVLCKL